MSFADQIDIERRIVEAHEQWKNTEYKQCAVSGIPNIHKGRKVTVAEARLWTRRSLADYLGDRVPEINWRSMSRSRIATRIKAAREIIARWEHWREK